MNFAIYVVSTGKITRRIINCPASTVAIQCQEGEEFYLNCPDYATHIINNEPVTLVPEVIPPTLEEAKAAKLLELAAARYAEETGGTTVNSATVATDRDSQALVTGAYVSLKQGFASIINWKCDNGWVTLSLAEIEPIAQAVCAHVQACFTKEGQLAAQVEAATTVEEVNVIVWQ